MVVPVEFPSLKGFDFGLDKAWGVAKSAGGAFPSLKGFDFGLDF